MGKVGILALTMALALVLATGSGCGRKGPPVAPEAGERSAPSQDATKRR
ncbi:MAG: hypothetical protein OEZ55_11535 [Nitrospinota bacterium]|nr:hypothetical protein [Nitrospinota bacterium]